ncbi:hypothetical protein ACQKP0_03345 [Heyndrickxia sp. NPDC080065]|uniref:hypothetical protein n=1 Tax=Heyndrickxia sp. NPDC080065 TaxID=3390568 RepID=UPI003D04F71E
MRKLAVLADRCWEGLTLQHVTQKEIVIPYLLFVIIAFLFELFLIVLFTISSIVFYQNHFQPQFEYYVCGVILIVMFLLTVPMLMKIITNQLEKSLLERI